MMLQDREMVVRLSDYQHHLKSTNPGDPTPHDYFNDLKMTHILTAADRCMVFLWCLLIVPIHCSTDTATILKSIY